MARIGREDRRASARFRHAAVEAARLIGAYPHIGSVRLEFAPAPYRFVVMHGFPYVLVHEPGDDEPVILRVVHGSQDLAVLLSDLPHAPG